MGSEAIIEFSDVHLEFANLVVHRQLNFKIFSGESVTILGPSGSGKTLILKMIIGLISPSSGTLKVLGQDFATLTETELIALRRNIGMLFQGAALFDSLTVFENVAYALRQSNKLAESQIADCVHEKLNVVGLPNIANKLPSELSGGQKKRVGLARALASSPRIMLFDEPTTGLDPTATRLIDNLVIKLKQDYAITCVSVTHDIASARRFSERWILINRGNIVADGMVADIEKNSRDVLNFTSGNWADEISL